jgi:hypothetical protein
VLASVQIFCVGSIVVFLQDRAVQAAWLALTLSGLLQQGRTSPTEWEARAGALVAACFGAVELRS